ncbi:hypothetical protein GJ496_004271 [Pomphorhynchus laevis]|nr:hypothetical protein GJ496_004271 [Pomphorhynchus laevis]
MQEGSLQDVDGATDLSKFNCRFLDEVLEIQCALQKLEYEHTGRACFENIAFTDETLWPIRHINAKWHHPTRNDYLKRKCFLPIVSSDKLQISPIKLLIPSDDTTDATVTYLLDVTWMIIRWEHLPVVEHAVCDGDDEGLPLD